MIKKGRFRILHSIKPIFDNYKWLVEKILNNTNDLKNIYLFIPEIKLKVREILRSLDFEIQIYSWLSINKPYRGLGLGQKLLEGVSNCK